MSDKKKSISLKDLDSKDPIIEGPSIVSNLLVAQKQSKHRGSREKPPAPLPSLFRMHPGKPDTNNTGQNDLSSFLNNSKKGSSFEEGQEELGYKVKILKGQLENIPEGRQSASYREVLERTDRERNRTPNDFSNDPNKGGRASDQGSILIKDHRQSLPKRGSSKREKFPVAEKHNLDFNPFNVNKAKKPQLNYTRKY